MGIDLGTLIPNYTTCVFSGGFTSEAQWLRLRTERQMGAAVLSFVGDLDPVDFMVFATLVVGTTTHRLRVVHMGVDDAWLRISQKFATSRSAAMPWDPMAIRMSSFEVAALHALRGIRGAIPENVGSQCNALLDAGYKLELEGASNPAFYRSDFSAALRRMLRRRMVHAANGGNT